MGRACSGHQVQEHALQGRECIGELRGPWQLHLKRSWLVQGTVKLCTLERLRTGRGSGHANADERENAGDDAVLHFDGGFGVCGSGEDV